MENLTTGIKQRLGTPGRSHLVGHILALFVTIVWGTTLISSKILLRVFTPLEIMTFRFVIAWLVLFCLHPKPLVPKSVKEELPFVAAALSGLTLYFTLENTALKYTLASNVGIIISAAPMFSALLMWLSHRSPRPRGLFFVGFAIAMTGIALISLTGEATLEINPLGDLLTLGAALCWGAYGVCLELTASSGLNQLQITRKVFFWGLVTSVPLFPLFRPEYALDRFADPTMLLNVLYLGLVASALCFVCWNKAMTLIGTVATNVYIYLTPVVTLIGSAVILGEPVRPQAVGAIGLILLGLWLSQRKLGQSAGEQ